MTLTVFHNITIEERYRKSLARLTEGENLPQKEGLDLHYAIYNGGVLGLSVTDGNRLLFIKVLNITRRRGVGAYLYAETVKFVRKKCGTEIQDETPAGLAHDSAWESFRSSGAVTECLSFDS